MENVPLFDSVYTLPGFADAAAQSMTSRSLSSGEYICRAGETGRDMYVVITGEVELLAPNGIRLNVLSQGQHFGEISILYGGTRNASARATRSPTIIASLSKQRLEDLMIRFGCKENIMKNAQHIPYVKQWFIRSVPLFQTCSEDSEFIDAIAEKLRYQGVKYGEEFIKAGEIGSEMYFIVAGQAEVLADRRKVKTLEPGSYTGEISLLFGGPRTATVRSTAVTHLYALSKRDFDAVLDRFPSCVDAIYGTAQETRYLKEYFIKKLPLFEDMKNNAEFVFNMSDALHSKSFHPRDNVVMQGDSGSEMFFIARGDAKVIINGSEVAELHGGQFFGELSLLYDEPRSATVRAINYCHTYVLTQEAFEVIAVAFPEWWSAITSKGDIFSRVQGSRGCTETVRHGLSLPSINNTPRATPSAGSSSAAPASRADMIDRDALRRELARPDRSPRSRTTEDRLQELIDQKLCLCCCEKEKCMLVVPCGHVSACDECSTRLTSCPQCRGPVQQLFRAII